MFLTSDVAGEGGDRGEGRRAGGYGSRSGERDLRFYSHFRAPRRQLPAQVTSLILFLSLRLARLFPF